MNHHHAFRIFLLILLSVCFAVPSVLCENTISPGYAKFAVRILVLDNTNEEPKLSENFNVEDFLSRVDVYCATKSVFDNKVEDNVVALTRNNTIFHGEIPIERIEEIAGVQLYFDGEFQGGSHLMLRQDRINGITLYLSPKGEFLNIEYQELSLENWMDIGATAMNTTTANPFMFVPSDKSLYDSWESIRNWQSESAWPKYFAHAIDGRVLPESEKAWIENNVKKAFAAYCVLRTAKNAEELADKYISEPPMEAYSFLDSIDYSPDIFLKQDLVFPMGWFLGSILEYPCAGKDSIGETNVAEWKADISKALQPAISQPSDLLLDLLSGMSYINQINRGTPLTEVQIKNIKEGYTDGIGEIILANNAKLIEAQKHDKRPNIYDFSESDDFSIKEFIDEHYTGRPVVVDFWNTWCSPCMSAIYQTEDIKRHFANTDLVFVYISDTSSDNQEWETKAKDIGAEQIKISQKLSNEILESHNLSGYPSYMFFDRNHKLAHKQTSFPGPTRYRNLLDSICKSAF